MLSGLPLPDIRGTMGTFYYFGTDLSRYEEGNTEFGGILKRLVFDGDVAQTELVGPPNPIVRQQLRAARAKTPRSRSRQDEDRRARSARGRPRAAHGPLEPRRASRRRSTLGDSTIHLAEHEWSKWINLDFSINMLVRVHGMAQLLSDRRRPGTAAVRLAGELAAGQSAGADVVAGLVCRRHLRAARPVPHARLGRGDVAAERGPHRREDVHGRSLPRVRRPRAGDPPADRREAMGSARRRHRIDRSRAAHDVAAHRSAAPDVRQGARGEVRRFDRARLPQVRRVRRRSR